MITPAFQKQKYSVAELIAAADRYSRGVESNPIVLRKAAAQPPRPTWLHRSDSPDELAKQ